MCPDSRPFTIATDDPITASPKLFVLPSHCILCLTNSLKYPCVGVTETLCDEMRVVFLQGPSSHGVTKLSYGEDGIIINTTPYSHQGNIWKSFTRGQNLGSSFLPAREPINGCLFHASQELVLIRLSFLGTRAVTL